MLACVPVQKRVCETCAHAGVLEDGTQKCDTGASLLCFDVAFALHAQNYHLAPLRSETDKGRHEVTFPHSDVTACENPVAQQLLSLLTSNVYQSLSFSPLSLIKPN